MTFHVRTFLAGAILLGTTALPTFAKTERDMPIPNGDGVFHTQNIQKLGEDVGEATAGSLFAHPQIKDSVRRGLAPIGEVLMSRLADEDPVFSADSIPFLASSYDEARALWDASRPLVEEKLSEQGAMLLHAMPRPGRSLYTQEPVESTADVPTAFATGRADAINISASTGVSSQARDFSSHYTELALWLPATIPSR